MRKFHNFTVAFSKPNRHGKQVFKKKHFSGFQNVQDFCKKNAKNWSWVVVFQKTQVVPNTSVWADKVVASFDGQSWFNDPRKVF